MPDLTIQRVPRGLSEALTIFGGQTPVKLGDTAVGQIDLLQFYGLSQIQLPTTVDGALASAGTVDIIVPQTQWWLFFQSNVSVTEQAALTSLQLQLGFLMQQQSNQLVAFAEKKAGFIATDEFILAHVSPYPRLLPPLTRIRARARFAGVATVACGITATVGVFG